MTEVKPHFYIPDWVTMGDCRVCGHVQESGVHLPHEMSGEEKSTLSWIADGEKAQYGECFGDTLDRLMARGYVEIRTGREHQSGFIAQGDTPKHQAVFVTHLGMMALKEADRATDG